MGISEPAIRQQLEVILTKLVANDHKREVIEAAQRGLSSIISRGKLAGEPGADYITKEEFAEFKKSLGERFKSLSGELG